MTLLPYLDSHLGNPTRLLTLGWDEATHEHLRVRHDVHPWQAGSQDVGAGSFDAALWNHSDDSIAPQDLGETVERFRRALRDRGQLIVVTPLEDPEPEITRQRGALPSRHQVRLRQVVQSLSEAGFAITRDHSLTVDAGTEDETAPDWKILTARKDPFLIRPYQAGDEDAILRLFQTCFHIERGLDHWRWKYADNPYGGPSGRCRISLAVAPGGELASHYGGYPIPVWRDGSFVALQMGDTMTDTSFRNTGRGKSSLLARTVRHFFSIHRDGSCGFYFGFNTGPIQRFCRWFIGGSQTLPVHFRSRPLAAAPSWSAGRGYRVERVDQVDIAWDRFFQRVAPHYRFLVQRDAKYLNWRYLRCPDVNYVLLAVRRWGRLVGWGVFRRRGDHLAWGDALFHPRHARAAESLLAAAVTQPELAGASDIDAWFPRQPAWWDRQLNDLGFRDQPEPQGLGMVALADTAPEAFAELDTMYTTMGDGDLF